MAFAGLLNEEARRTRFAIEIPKAASWILTHDPDGRVRGLEEFENAHPPVAIVFWAFRIMVGIGLSMIAVSWWTAVSLTRRKPLSGAMLRALAAMTFAGWIATLAGWYVTEIGRQPWLVYGALRTAETAAPHAPETVLGTLLAYAALYVLLLVAYVAALRHLATKPAASLRMLGPMRWAGG